eukprot:gene13461-13587_t
MFYWAVSRDGTRVMRPHKVLYGQVFALYALGYYYRIFKDSAASALASACFMALDSLWHNSTTGGYNEATLNPLALQRVTQLMDIFCNRLDLVQGHLMSDYKPTAAVSGKTWQPTVTATVSYGHNLEAAWMMSDVADYLQSIQAITPATRDSYYQRLMGIAQAALRDGYDQIHGGVFELGSPSKGPTSRVKVWWVQDETLLALYKMYKYFGEDPQYLTKRLIRCALSVQN